MRTNISFDQSTAQPSGTNMTYALVNDSTSAQPGAVDLDVRSSPFMATFMTELEPTLRMTYLIIVSIATALGNLLVLVAVLRFPSLRRATNAMLGSLAVSDFLVGIVTVPLYILWTSRPGIFDRSSFMCGLVLLSCLLVATASQISLLLLSVEQYLAVCHTFWHRSLVLGCPRLHALGVAFVWLASFVTSALSLLAFRKDSTVSCNYYSVFDPTFLLVASVLGAILPSGLIVYLNVRVLLVVKDNEKRIALTVIGGHGRRRGKRNSCSVYSSRTESVGNGSDNVQVKVDTSSDGGEGESKDPVVAAAKDRRCSDTMPGKRKDVMNKRERKQGAWRKEKDNGDVRSSVSLRHCCNISPKMNTEMDTLSNNIRGGKSSVSQETGLSFLGHCETNDNPIERKCQQPKEDIEKDNTHYFLSTYPSVHASSGRFQGQDHCSLNAEKEITKTHGAGSSQKNDVVKEESVDKTVTMSDRKLDKNMNCSYNILDQRENSYMIKETLTDHNNPLTKQVAEINQQAFSKFHIPKHTCNCENKSEDRKIVSDRNKNESDSTQSHTSLIHQAEVSRSFSDSYLHLQLVRCSSMSDNDRCFTRQTGCNNGVKKKHAMSEQMLVFNNKDAVTPREAVEFTCQAHGKFKEDIRIFIDSSHKRHELVVQTKSSCSRIELPSGRIENIYVLRESGSRFSLKLFSGKTQVGLLRSSESQVWRLDGKQDTFVHAGDNRFSDTKGEENLPLMGEVNDRWEKYQVNEQSNENNCCENRLEIDYGQQRTSVDSDSGISIDTNQKSSFRDRDVFDVEVDYQTNTGNNLSSRNKILEGVRGKKKRISTISFGAGSGKRKLTNLMSRLRQRSRSTSVTSMGGISQKVSRMVALVCASFMVAWFPFVAAVVANTLCDACSLTYFLNAAIMVAFSKSMVNPVLYALCHIAFRDAYSKVFKSLGLKLCC